MVLLIIITAGISGTAFMTLFLYLFTALIHRQLKVVKILGTMLTNQTTPDGGLSELPWVIWVGVTVHYLIGVMFTLGYYFLWQFGIGSPDYESGAVFGFLTGLFGITVWRVVFWLHPNPPRTVSLPIYLLSLLIAHVIFGVFVHLTYSLLVQRMNQR
ncbi:DUF6789 family protein [Runella slithyformis]|uniref:DUF2938 domain-containing protein n=1 Tax=Runella slithyformis (strain ATCC 29530 / DSM 19594 / LMG 11500 / NCIMB 11436 / LSU 4) TaxID=761193 RepID=A0A7U4E7L8_RUNSL|nr:DUF6789 family protein [Runella slithyformis]AEI50793.1 hypothetical protein Runsl_4470 [Runella slithyformis DSM 19594]